VLRRSTRARSAAEVVRRGSRVLVLACRGYGGETVAELIGDPPSNGGGVVVSRTTWPGKTTGELEERKRNAMVQGRE
jgi:hypothetical protein